MLKGGKDSRHAQCISEYATSRLPLINARWQTAAKVLLISSSRSLKSSFAAMLGGEVLGANLNLPKT